MVIASFFWYQFCKIDIWEISKLNTKNNPTKVKKCNFFGTVDEKFIFLTHSLLLSVWKSQEKSHFTTLQKDMRILTILVAKFKYLEKYETFLVVFQLLWPLFFFFYFSYLKPYLSLDDSASPSTDSSRHQQTRQIELMKF